MTIGFTGAGAGIGAAVVGAVVAGAVVAGAVVAGASLEQADMSGISASIKTRHIPATSLNSILFFNLHLLLFWAVLHITTRLLHNALPPSCMDLSYCCLSQCQLRSLNYFILDSDFQVDIIGTESGNPDYQVAIVFGMCLSILQCIGADNIKLQMIPA